MTRSLLLLPLLCAIANAQVSAPLSEPPPLPKLVWSYLEVESAAEERRIYKELHARKDLTAEKLHAILDAGPARPTPQAGTFAGRPFTIPGVKRGTTYTIGIPEGLKPGQRAPVWITIHGTGGTERWAFRDVWRFLGPKGVIVIAPTEAKDLHGQGWGYRHRERSLHMDLLDELARTLPLDLSRVYVGGLSRGGHAAFDLGMRYSDRIAGAMPVIGAVQQRDRALLVNLHSLRLHSMNGEQDQPALVEGARKAIARLKELGYPTTALFDPNRGHGSFADHYPVVISQLLERRRDPAPKKIHFAVRDLTYGRHYWVRVTGLHKSAYKPGRPVKIPGVGRMNEAQKLKAYLAHIEEHTPWIRAEIAANKVTVSTKRVTRFELFLPASLIDVTRPVQVVVNGRTRFKKKTIRPPTPAKALRLLRAFGTADPAFRFVDKLPLTVR
ncbi:MAG: hypothetical protein CMJ83_21385 [Planctomycetes bacterium]|nr:hypothetical protein [Planctomycetota bacterium]